MKQFILAIGSIYGALSVIFGAFGAHLLKTKISAEKLTSFETGIRYQMYHALLLLFVGFAFQFTSGLEKTTAWFLIIGTFLFSFSIYFLSLQEFFKLNLKFLGPITPLGGLFLVMGWIMLFICFLKQQ